VKQVSRERDVLRDTFSGRCFSHRDRAGSWGGFYRLTLFNKEGTDKTPPSRSCYAPTSCNIYLGRGPVYTHTNETRRTTTKRGDTTIGDGKVPRKEKGGRSSTTKQIKTVTPAFALDYKQHIVVPRRGYKTPTFFLTGRAAAEHGACAELDPNPIYTKPRLGGAPVGVLDPPRGTHRPTRGVIFDKGSSCNTYKGGQKQVTEAVSRPDKTPVGDRLFRQPTRTLADEQDDAPLPHTETTPYFRGRAVKTRKEGPAVS